MEKTGVAKSVEMAMLETKDAPAKVIAWYDNKMSASGYKKGSSATKSTVRDQDSTAREYRKGDTLVLVQVTTSTESTEQKSVITLTRFDGISKDFSPETTKSADKAEEDAE